MMNNTEAIRVLRGLVDHYGPTWNTTTEGRTYRTTVENAINAVDNQQGLPMPTIPVPHDPLKWERSRNEAGSELVSEFAVSDDLIFSVIKSGKKSFKTFRYAKNVRNEWASTCVADEKDLQSAIKALGVALPVHSNLNQI